MEELNQKNEELEKKNEEVNAKKKYNISFQIKGELPAIYNSVIQKETLYKQLKNHSTSLEDKNDIMNIKVDGKEWNLTKEDIQGRELRPKINEFLKTLEPKQSETKNISDEMNLPKTKSEEVEDNKKVLKDEAKDNVKEIENPSETKKGEIEGSKTETVNKEKNNLNQFDEPNYLFLKKQMKYIGFGESPDLHKQLRDGMGNNPNEFKIKTESDKASFGNKASFDLHFNKSETTGRAFLNKFDANITNEKRGVDLTQTFAVKQGGITAKQSINLLEGRAVKTNLKNAQGEKESVYMKLNLKETNEFGLHKIQVWDKKHGIDATKIVDKSPLVFKEDDGGRHKDITIKSLEKGNIVGVSIKGEGGNVINGKAVLNPEYKNLQLYDNSFKRINDNKAVVLENEGMDNSQKSQYSKKR